MRRMKKLTMTLVVVMMLGLLAACGKSFDAAGYTKALLDNSYKNDSTAFVEMKIGTAEEAAQLYEEGLDTELQAMADGAGIDTSDLEGFREIFAKLLAGAKYTVGEAVEQKDGSFVVTITYEQMQVFGPAMENYMESITAMTEEWMSVTSEEELPTEEEMYAAIFDELKVCMTDAVANATYAEPATTTVRIELIDNVYQPNQEDIFKLESLIFDTDAAMAQ